MTGSERRTTQRFTMRLPLTVRWTTGAAVGETSTESRDVSSRGVYFYLAKDVKEEVDPAGADVTGFGAGFSNRGAGRPAYGKG